MLHNGHPRPTIMCVALALVPAVGPVYSEFEPQENPRLACPLISGQNRQPLSWSDTLETSRSSRVAKKLDLEEPTWRFQFLFSIFLFVLMVVQASRACFAALIARESPSPWHQARERPCQGPFPLFVLERTSGTDAQFTNSVL